MNNRELNILEKAFSAEICAAVCGLGIFQTKSKLARKLETEGYLQKYSLTLGERFPVTVEGYVLTHLGRLTYCMSCNNP